MVKRKASVSIDEWLDIEAIPSHITPEPLTATTEAGTSKHRPTAKGLHLGGKDQLTTCETVDGSGVRSQLLAGIPVAGTGGRATDGTNGNHRPVTGETVGVDGFKAQPITGGSADTTAGRAQPMTGGVGIVAEAEVDSGEWFWRILELAGYERW